MKKNTMMRVASVLLIAVLLSTCAISGTFAKYVTEGSANDSARVAKWGVQISTEGVGYFTNTYAKDSATDIANTVVADVDVVAPGTTYEDAAIFSISGQPEVAVNVKFEITGAEGAEKATDVVLAAGEYWDWTKAPYTTKFTADEYHPLVFRLEDSNGTLIKEGTLANIESFLEGKSGDYAPGTDLKTVVGGTGVYKLTWSWNFNQSADKEDTLLGNIAAGIDTATAGTSIGIYIGIKITATQID